ncbi:MAG: hypothetical protein R6U17_02145 [Thermoplasmata archaeon]
MSGERYGIVVCTSCGFARAVDLRNKTTGCSHCKKRLDLSRMRIYYKTNSTSELSWAVGRMNAKLNKSEIPVQEEKESDIYGRIVKRLKEGSNRKERLIIMASMLTSEFGSFGREEMMMLNERTDLGDIDEVMEHLRKLDEIYEPREEKFIMVLI